MRMTIEPTMNQDDNEKDLRYPTASVSVNCDDLNLEEVIEELVAPALIAAGYHPLSVQRRLMPVD